MLKSFWHKPPLQCWGTRSSLYLQSVTFWARGIHWFLRNYKRRSQNTSYPRLPPLTNSHQPQYKDSSPQQLVPTFCDDAFKVDDVGVIELPHDACFSQEISPLFLCVAHLQGFDSHRKLTLSLQLQPPTADFPKFTFREKSERTGSQHVEGKHSAHACLQHAAQPL